MNRIDRDPTRLNRMIREMKRFEPDYPAMRFASTPYPTVCTSRATIEHLSIGQTGLSLFRQSSKRHLVTYRQIGQHLTIDLDGGLV